MYEIRESKNHWGDIIYNLYHNQMPLHTIKPKYLDNFLNAGNNISNSEHIEKWLKYNNL